VTVPSRRSRLLGVCVLGMAVVVTGCNATARALAMAVRCGRPSVSTVSTVRRPNIVFVLADDLSQNLVPYMPHVLGLERTGTTFANYTVTDSLCCPSRASILTGRFPHDTDIYTNTAPDGGFAKFFQLHEQNAAFNVALAKAGYRTAMMGKYLNGYRPGRDYGSGKNYIPPGWTEWDVAGEAYHEFNYHLNEDGQIRYYGDEPGDYLTTVLTQRADAFIATCALQRAPFFLEVATFAPHAPYVAEPADQGTLGGLQLSRAAPFDRLPKHGPAWLRRRPPLSQAKIAHFDQVYERRAESVLSIDRMIGSIEATLARTGEASSTDIFFSSDNGYHIGEYRLAPGKRTAYDTDVVVPLVGAGPGIRRGHVAHQVAQNIDLAPTFESLAGVTPPPTVDGRSLKPLLRHKRARVWRRFALIEHQHTALVPGDPDSLDGRNTSNPPTYEALRTRRFTYVEYANGAREYYDRLTDPQELDNRAASLPPQRRARLHAELQRLADCHGSRSCWRAGGARTHRCPATTYREVSLTRGPTLRCRGPRPTQALRKG
jgi:N-acetylglucosamine-6-sulfatase